MAPLWLAYEQGLFREQGLDVELVFLSSVRTDQGVLTGDTPIGYGTNVVAMRLSGGDLVAIAGVANVLSYTLFAQPGLATPQDLRGKTMVVTQPGASNTLAALITLRHFGLEPHRDVALQPTQGSTEQLAILQQGLADAGLFSPPADAKALELGLVPLADLKALNIPFFLTGIGTTESYSRSHSEVVRRFLRGYVVGVGAARKNAEAAKAVIAKYTQTDDPAIVDASYRYYRDLWARPDFRVPPAAIASVLRVLDVPGAATAKPEDFIDNRFVDELHESGFIRQVAPFD
ncbi:MAG TPA: ABC transporter substrate-binding protein [Chloroflexota bacterium]|nr:ABC transporter substrate-binding protein [Chloroflexota bacterium]